MAESRICGSIRLMHPDGSTDLFTVGRCITAGRGMTCYAAELAGRKGILRELYPQDQPEEALYFGLTRDADNQLGYEGFGLVAPREAYLSARNPCRSSLNALIQAATPPSSPLHGLLGGSMMLSGQRNGQPLDSLYVWTPGTVDITFDAFCREIRLSPQHNALGKLRQTLLMIRALTEAVQLLHGAGFLHRDIAPGHFGFGDGQIRLLDLSSLCSVGMRSPGIAGTPLYREMETARPLHYRPGAHTDVYAIGMTLAQALFAPDYLDEDALRFRPQDSMDAVRRRIGRCTEDSLLLYACLPASSEARGALTELLARTLSPQLFRFRNCVMLLSALDELLSLLPR